MPSKASSFRPVSYTFSSRKHALIYDRAGSYTCPFLFSLPKDAPPTINLPHGSRTYQLKAHIHRTGLLVPSVTRSVPFTVVLLSEHEQSFVNTSHEDKWEDSLLYAWRVGRNPAFVLGETIPLELTLVPLEKVFIHKITVALQRESSTFHFELRSSILKVNLAPSRTRYVLLSSLLT